MNDLAPLALIAAAAALWQQIRGFFERIRALVLVRATLHGGIAEITSDYLFTQARIVRWGDRCLRSSSTWVRPIDRVAEVVYETPPQAPLLGFLHRRPILLNGSPVHPGSTALENRMLTITGLRGFLDIEDLTRKALEASMKRQTCGKRYFVRRVGSRRKDELERGSIAPAHTQTLTDIRPSMPFLHWKSDDIGAPQPQEPFSALALCKNGEAAKADFLRWLSLKSWHQDRGIPWRRGHLYYGPPGTGKTSLARAIAQQADMPVFAYDLSTLDNESFVDAWKNMQEYTPCMALIEDVDGVFHGRQNILNDNLANRLTFDCLLNALGGIQTCDGVFVVITTNCPERLDDALGKPLDDGSTTRPGRLDRAYCLDLPSGDQRLAIVRRIVGKAGPLCVSATQGMTAAQVTEWSIKEALTEQWQQPPSEAA